MKQAELLVKQIDLSLYWVLLEQILQLITVNMRELEFNLRWLQDFFSVETQKILPPNMNFERQRRQNIFFFFYK